MALPPTRPDRSDWLRLAPAAVAGAALIIVAARLTVTLPGGAVPQTLQSAAVLGIAAFGGLRAGLAGVILYIGLGVAGLPVFSDGGAGWQHAAGTSAGYLAGFVVAAAIVGRFADAGLNRRFTGAFTAALLGHVVILTTGWLGLLRYVGALEAWRNGVVPFGDGAVAKSLLIGLLVPAGLWLRRRATA